ncbi:MAG: DUF4256 domain-containing protein [Chitinophagaceae bacterium]
MPKKQVIPQENIIDILKHRFEANIHRHKNLDWKDVEEKILKNKQALKSLEQMENSGGEPDVIGFEQTTEKYIFVDCSKESPTGRRSCCYDDVALENRKEFKPKHSAMAMAKAFGIEILNETEYKQLQSIENVDTKTSSWLNTPPELRNLDGAIFGDFRFGRVFIYHNGASSYYASRGFRGKLLV